MKSTFKNGVFNFEIDGYAVELYKENDLWLDKVYTLFGHVVNRISSEKSIKFSEVVDEMKKDIQEAKEIESKFDEAIYILIVDLISRKKQFGLSNVNLDEITESVKDNIRTSLNKLYLQQLIEVGLM